MMRKLLLTTTFLSLLAGCAMAGPVNEQDSQGGDATDTTNHAVREICVLGCSGTGSNAAAGPTGSPVPADAGYTGFDVGGNLVGVSAANPFPVTIISMPSVTISGTVPVSGTFWQATQPVSLAAVPLPAGASTSALQISGNSSLATLAGAVSSSKFNVNIASGSIANTAFAISGTLPAFASTPTFNIGTGGPTNYALETGGNLALLASTVAGGDVRVNCVVGCGGGGGSNAAAGPTGSAVPADGGYTAFNVGGNLVGVSNANPFPVYFPSAQSVTFTNSTLAVTGTFFQATQPVSLASQPLPTGASTSALQNIANTDLGILAGGVSGGLFQVNCVSGCPGGGGGGAVTMAASAVSAGAYVAGSIIDVGTGASPGANTLNGRLASIESLQATAANQSTMITDLGILSGAVSASKFNVNISSGSIANTGFNVTGTLPAFAATPTFNLGTLGGAATAANQTTEIGFLTTVAAYSALSGTTPCASATTAGCDNASLTQLLINAVNGAIPNGTNNIGNTGPTGQSYANITTATTTTVKSGSGVLSGISVNTLVAGATITIYDNTAGSGTKIATLTLPSSITGDEPSSLTYDIAFSTGLTLVTSGATDVTVRYR